MPCLRSVKRSTLGKGLSERELYSGLLSYEWGGKYPKESVFLRQWFLRTSPTPQVSKFPVHMNIYLISFYCWNVLIWVFLHGKALTLLTVL